MDSRAPSAADGPPQGPARRPWLLAPVPAQRAAALPAPPSADGARKCGELFSVLLRSSQSWMRFSEVFTKGVFRPLKTRRILTLTLENLGTMIIKDVCLLISHHN